MQYGRIDGVDKNASRIAQGAMMLGFGDIADDFALLDTVWEQGVTLFDSAYGYGHGWCDRVFGQWVKARGVRDQLILMDKCCHHRGDVDMVRPEVITTELDHILQRLGFDYVDVLSFHRDDPSQPVGPLVERMNELIAEGRILAYGASNWSHERIAAANEYAAANGLAPMAVSSPQYSLAECLEDPWGRGSVTITGAAAAEARGWYQANQMPILPWSSLCGGFFTGRYRRDNLDELTTKDDARTIRCYCSDDNFTRYDRAAEMAESKGLTLPQIVLAWMIHSPMNVFPLTGAATGDEVRQNAAAADIELTEEEVAYLDLR